MQCALGIHSQSLSLSYDLTHPPPLLFPLPTHHKHNERLIVARPTVQAGKYFVCLAVLAVWLCVCAAGVLLCAVEGGRGRLARASLALPPSPSPSPSLCLMTTHPPIHRL